MVSTLSGPLFHPNDHYFMRGGDGIQSYFATSYYALYDKGVHFSGMNYPYGEHINYPNLQPLIAWVIGFLQRHGVPAARYTIGITNLVALLSLALTPLILYAVLRRFRLPVLYAALTGLFITMLSPQLLRMGGHTSLSYSCFLPLLWYFIIRMQESPREWRWYGWFIGTSVFVSAIMPYFTAAASFFLLAHVLVLEWQHRRPRPLQWRMLVAALLPLLLYRSWLWLTDPITDRPRNPFGLTYYISSWNGIFVPYFNPGREIWKALFPIADPQFEGVAYVGLVTGGVLAVGLLLGVGPALRQALKRGRWRRLGRPVLPAPLAAGLWAGGLLLMYSFGYPLKWHWFAWVKDHSGPIKQFRALGRFTWPFYYVASVYGAYCLYRLWRYLRQRGVARLALPWMPLLLLIWGAEAWVNFSHVSTDVSRESGAASFLDPDSPAVQQLSWSNHNPEDFQAIMPLPYYNIGSDKIDLSGTPESVFNAENLACATGLPLLATYVSRPSVEQMIRHVQLLSGPLLPKPLLLDFPSAKPVLLMVATGSRLTPAEQRLVDLAKPLSTSVPEFSLYELSLEALGRTDIAAERAKGEALLPSLTKQPNGVWTTTPRGVLLESYNQQPDRRGHLSPGCFYAAPEQFSRLYDGPLPMPADTGRYEVSVWVNIKNAYGNGNLQIYLSAADGRPLDHLVADGRTVTEVDGDWIRVVLPFHRTADAARIEVLYDSRDLIADDLLIRPIDTDVYYYAPTGQGRQLVKNTYQLGR